MTLLKPIIVKKVSEQAPTGASAKASTSRASAANVIKDEGSDKTPSKPQIAAKKGPAQLDWSKAKTKDSPRAESATKVKKEESSTSLASVESIS